MENPNNVVFCESISIELKRFFGLNKYSKVATLVDENTLRHCYPIVRESIPEHFVIEIKSGESHKNINTCVNIWSEMTSQSLDRKALLINLGGGVIGDMGGFCAATYKRGIEFINIPTTLLAQVDASIGGKLGIDFDQFKNHIGIFQNPKRVFIDDAFFQSLPDNELRSGYAEIIKHCLIRDAQKFSEISNTGFDGLDYFELTRHSVDIKEKVVQEDPKESGLRKILNFGHTVGHAIESTFLKDPGNELLHGEAIAIGMICELFLSEKKLGMSNDEVERAGNYIMQVYDPVEISEDKAKEIVKLIKHDKKNEGDKIHCSLLNHIGDCAFNVPINEQDVMSSIDYYNQKIKT